MLSQNKFGYCNEEHFCRYIHTSETCDNENCLKIHCNERHPQTCSYFNQFQKCNFSICAYELTKKFSEKNVQELMKRVANLEAIYYQDKNANETDNKDQTEL